ncbi:MAG: hypothetical protein IIA89_12705 [Chloroflexi bacterium]|nr:hypothetical protein [Chloroflexota bacterium]MCH8877664.1 hypothetical protein [Chloroflexota bacterium]MCI0807330.1 hypothetical protein [Chloroflexota bacterium]
MAGEIQNASGPETGHRERRAKFAVRYPQYAAALFDEHFLANRAAGLLERYITPDDPPKSVELAAAWAEQIHMREGTKAALVSELAPVASKFLFVFKTELMGREWNGQMATEAPKLS